MNRLTMFVYFSFISICAALSLPLAICACFLSFFAELTMKSIGANNINDFGYM